MASRKIEDLLPPAAVLCRQFISRCDDAGIDVIITSTYRSIEEQNQLYQQGRSKPGNRVTNAKGGDSYHNWRVAFDFAPLKNGKIDWNDTDLFKRCGKIAEECGLEWGGSWKSFKDYPHCQYTQGLSLADFKSGKTLTA
jgi:peptidoglycan L-alanyl-D-glutamate endopeptidase CwlK